MLEEKPRINIQMNGKKLKSANELPHICNKLWKHSKYKKSEYKGTERCNFGNFKNDQSSKFVRDQRGIRIAKKKKRFFIKFCGKRQKS